MLAIQPTNDPLQSTPNSSAGCLDADLRADAGRTWRWLRLEAGSIPRIPNPDNQLFLRCTNCRILFPSKVKLPPVAFEGTAIEDREYKCPVCANIDTYSKSDLFYDKDDGFL